MRYRFVKHTQPQLGENPKEIHLLGILGNTLETLKFNTLIGTLRDPPKTHQKSFIRDRFY